MDWIWVPWASLLLLVAADALARRGSGADPGTPPGSPSRKAILTVAGVALAAGLLRLPFALGRGLFDRNVDEVQYAMTAAFARTSGESLFSWPWNLHGHQLLYLLGSLERPFVVVDGVACLVVGLTAFCLGLTVLRAGAGLNAALLTVPFYAVGVSRFEGLGSNKELFVNLFLAAYLLVRLGPPGARPWLRRVLAGACLGAAVIMKEQALVFLLLEPLLEVLDRVRARAEATPAQEQALRFLRHEALASAGFFVPVGLFLAAFAAHGQLGAYLAWLVDWATSGGAPLGSFALGPPLIPSFHEEPSAVLVLLNGLLPLCLSAVLVLGLLSVGRLLAEGRRLAEPARRFKVGLMLMACCAVVGVSIGMRWFNHYWLLLFPAMAPLAALRVLELPAELKHPKRRLVAGVIVLLIVVTGAREAIFLGSEVGRQVATGGGGLQPGPRAAVERVGDWVRANTPPDRPILVWGWRPELYAVAQRTPATRYVGGVTATAAQAIDDLRRLPAPSVVLELPFVFDPQLRNRNPFELDRHPALAEWLSANGYERVAGPGELEGYTAWARR